MLKTLPFCGQKLAFASKCLLRSILFAGAMCISSLAIAQAPTSLSYPSSTSSTDVDAVYMAPTVSGIVTSYGISPALPTGLSLNTSTGVISGTPTITSGPTTYTVTATNGSGFTTTTFSLTTVKSYYDNANNQVVFRGVTHSIPKVGTGTSAGDIVLYTDVAVIGGVHIDCIVKTVSITGGMTFTAYDQNLATDGSTFSSNDSNFFSPQVSFTAAGSCNFHFQFILSGSYDNATNTGTDVTLMNVKLNTYDIDGNGGASSNQHNEFGGFSTSELGSPTSHEVVTFDASTGLTKYTSNTNANTLSVTDPTNRIRVSYGSMSDFDIQVGAGASGAAYFFLDFSVGSVSFTTSLTNAPVFDPNTALTGLFNGSTGCGSGLSFTQSGQTNITTDGTLNTFDSISVTIPTAEIVDGANEGIFVNGAATTIALNTGSTSTFTLSGLTFTYSVSTSGGVKRFGFKKNGAFGTFSLAQAEALVDALQYVNSAASPTAGDRDFTVNLYNSQFISPDADFTATLNCVSISGHIYHDANALTDNTVNPNSTIGQFADNSLFAVLVNASTNQVVLTQGITSSAYNFGTATPGDYNIYFATSAPSIGSTFSASTYPANYISTGENLGAGAGNDLLVDGKLRLTLGSTSITNANFGLELPPVTANTTLATQPNPGGFNFYTVAGSNFTNSDNDGTVDSMTITSFPTGANYLKIGSTYYTNGGTCPPLTSCTAWPGSVTIGVSGGLPLQSISVDPTLDAATSVVIPFTVFDNGHKVSNSSTTTIPFNVSSFFTVSGNVWDDNDADGNKVGGEAFVIPADGGQQLYAVLIQNTNTYFGVPTVYAATPVTAAAIGYTFSNIAGGNDYEVRIYSLASMPTAGTAASALSAHLATNWTGVSTNNSGVITAFQNTNNLINSLPALSGNKTNVNFGIEQIPTPSTITNSTVLNPGGTTQFVVPASTFAGADLDGTVDSIRITAFPSNTTTIVINGTSYTSGTFPVGGVTIPAPGGVPSVPITVDPIDGAVTVDIPYKTKDNGKIESTTTGHANQPFNTVSISGTVFDDATGITNSLIDGVVTNVGGTLFATLVQGGVALNTMAVTGAGTYNFSNLNGGSYTVVLSTTSGGLVPALPTSNWINTSEAISPAFNDGSIDGILPVTLTNTSVTGANFGIEQLPAPTTIAATSQVNPGGTTQATIPASTFAGTDPDGTVDSIRITAFPSNATTIVINGTSYTSGTFPVGGVTVVAPGGVPGGAITVDPIDGAVTVDIPYVTIDNAHKESPATGHAQKPFTTLTLSGIVFDDANGITNSLIDGVATNVGGTLFATLVQGGVALNTMAVSGAGTYSFSNLNGGSYTVVLSTTSGGLVPALPTTNWVNTSEAISPAFNDGSIDGILPVTLTNSNVTGANFGIEQLPTPSTLVAVSQVNPGGTTQATVPGSTFSATDPDGTVTSIRITSFPSNATSIVIDGISYTSGTFPGGGVVTTAPGGVPSVPITVDPIDGAVTVDIPYVAIDNAGKESTTTGHANQPFTTVSLSGTLFNDFNGVNNSLVDGVVTNVSGTMFASLINANGIVVASMPIANDGTYSFTGLNGGSYSVIVSTNSGVVSNPAPAIALPAGWVATSEAISPAFNDGTINSSISVTLTTSNVTGVNFGIEQPATAVVKSYTGVVSGGAGPIQPVTIPSTSGAGTYGNQAAMAGNASSGSTPGQLTGSDPDGNSGSVLTLGSGSGSSISFTVNPSTYTALDGGSTPVPTGMMLLYNGVQLQPGGCQGADVGNSLCSSWNGVTNQWEISNYNESSLTILAKGTVQTISFNYAWKDAASKQGSAALYTIMTSTPLAVHLLSFDAAATGTHQATLNWNASNENAGDIYGVERSTDGISFTELGRTPAKGLSGLAAYNFVDNAPVPGINYYRLHLLGDDGSSSYSFIRTLTFGSNAGSVNAYPNPVVNGSFRIDLNGFAGNSEITITDYSGRRIMHQSAAGSVSVSTIGWAAGLYTISVINNGQLYTTLIRVQ